MAAVDVTSAVEPPFLSRAMRRANEKDLRRLKGQLENSPWELHPHVRSGETRLTQPRRSQMADVEVKSFDSPDEVRQFEGNGQAEVVNVGGRVIGRGTFEPGWRWSENIKPIAQTDSCQVSHLGYVLSGRMKVMMDDGGEGEFGPGDVVAIPPGHDAEVVGDEACVLIDFGEFGEYAKRS